MSVKFLRPLMGLVVMMSIVLGAGMAYAGGGGGNEPRDTPAIVRDSGGSAIWYLRSSNEPACPASPPSVGFGASADTPIAIDSDGDGLDQIAIYRDQGTYGEFFIRANNDPGAAAVTRISFGLGQAAGDIPVAGNFDPSDADDEVGIYRTTTQEFFLDDGNPEPLRFGMGDPGDIPVIGNWDDSADGSDEVGVYRASNQHFYLRADNIPGSSAVTPVPMGNLGDTPVVGDYDRDGATTVGVFRDNSFGTFYLRNDLVPFSTVVRIDMGNGSDKPVMGDWDGPGTDGAGCL